jgi:hypothetical protein
MCRHALGNPDHRQIKGMQGMNRTTRGASPRRQMASMIVMALACVTLSACASFPFNSKASAPAPAPAPVAATTSDAPASPSSPMPASDDSQAPSSNTVANLQRLIDSNQLTELRTTYNATYGASLLFQTSKLSYYVALFHGKQFWRVIQTDSYETAESIYRSFAEQTRQLAQVDIDTTRLHAGNAYAEHLIALNKEHLQNLQQDASYQQQQAQQVATAQQQAKQQAVTLSADLNSTSSQLDAMKQRIRELEKQQTDPALILPAPSANATPAPTSSTPASGTPSP